MPSTRRWSVPPKRIAATAVFGVIGIFLVCGSVGMGSWLVAAIGIALIAVGGGILVLSALNSRATSEIEGTAHVLSASAPPSGSTYGRCRLSLVLYGKGINGVGVKIRDDAVPVAKWPDAGAELPVMISIDKPQRTRVLWGDVATHREAAEQRAREAEEQAAATAAKDDQYANLDAALDNVDGDVDDGAAAWPAEPAMATSGTRTIEMDVMDPSIMHRAGPPPGRPYGSRPSPFRRRRAGRGDPARPALDAPPPGGINAPPPPASAAPPASQAPPASAPPPPASPAPSGSPAPPTSPIAGGTLRSAPPEWPPRSAAAAAAAAALPHQWDDEDADDRSVAGEVGDLDFTGRRVPRNRPAPADELFDQDAPDDGPGYSPGIAYADDAGYDPDAGYNADAGYADPGQPDSAS